MKQLGDQNSSKTVKIFVVVTAAVVSYLIIYTIMWARVGIGRDIMGSFFNSASMLLFSVSLCLAYFSYRFFLKQLGWLIPILWAILIAGTKITVYLVSRKPLTPYEMNNVLEITGTYFFAGAACWLVIGLMSKNMKRSEL